MSRFEVIDTDGADVLRGAAPRRSAACCSAKASSSSTISRRKAARFIELLATLGEPLEYNGGDAALIPTIGRSDA